MVNKPTSFNGLLKKQDQITSNLAKELQELKNIKAETKALMQKYKSGRTQIKWPDPPG